MIYIVNAFSLNMLSPFRIAGYGWDRRPGDLEEAPDYGPVFTNVRIKTIRDPRAWLVENEQEDEVVSAVGHADTARLFSNILGRNVPAERRTVALGEDDMLLLGQYVGPRLPEGSTTLPEGAAVYWVKVFLD